MLAVREGLPLFLEANYKATGFYEQGSFLRLNKDIVVNHDGGGPIRIHICVGGEAEGGALVGARYKFR